MGLILGGASASDLILDGKSVSLYVGGNPPTKVWPTRETVQITLGTGNQTRDRFRAALADRGLDYTAVTEIPFDIELVGTGSAQYMFWGCWSLTHVPDMDTSQVTDMSGMFQACTSMTHAPAMNTSNVTSMSSMFDGCPSLAYVPDMDTSKVTNMSWMFSTCYALTTVPVMDTGNVTDMSGMFYECKALTHVPDMNTSSLVDTSWMFWGCAALTHAPAMDTAKVIGMNNMFQACTYLTSVPPMDTSQATSMSNMFNGCSSLTTVPAMDTAQVTYMNSMFNGCSSLTYVPDMDTHLVSDMHSMFLGCVALTDGNVRLIGKHPNVRTISMIDGSGLTRLPFYDTAGNLIPLTVTIKRTASSGFETSSTGDSILIDSWPRNGNEQGVSFTAPVTCDKDVRIVSAQGFINMVGSGETIPAGNTVLSGWSGLAGDPFVFTEVL